MSTGLGSSGLGMAGESEPCVVTWGGSARVGAGMAVSCTVGPAWAFCNPLGKGEVTVSIP